MRRKVGAVKRRYGAMAVVAVILVLGLVVVPAFAEEAYGATGSSMKSLQVKWDLKKGKKVTVTAAWDSVGKQKTTAVVKKLKVGRPNKKGYRKATFTVEFTQRFKPNGSQVHKMANSATCRDDNFAGLPTFVLVDYSTGRELGAYNNKGVAITISPWKFSKVKKYKDGHGCWVSFATKYSTKVTVAFPKKYKGLCLGVIGNNKRTESKWDDAFWNSYEPFSKTTYYKSGKKNSHWMRIR